MPKRRPSDFGCTITYIKGNHIKEFCVVKYFCKIWQSVTTLSFNILMFQCMTVLYIRLTLIFTTAWGDMLCI